MLALWMDRENLFSMIQIKIRTQFCIFFLIFTDYIKQVLVMD